VTIPLSSGHLHAQYQISLNLLSNILFISKRGNNLVIVHGRVMTQHQCGVECCSPDIDHVSWRAHKSSHSTGATSQENLLVERHLSTFLGESFTPDVVHRKPRHWICQLEQRKNNYYFSFNLKSDLFNTANQTRYLSIYKETHLHWSTKIFSIGQLNLLP